MAENLRVAYSPTIEIQPDILNLGAQLFTVSEESARSTGYKRAIKDYTDALSRTVTYIDGIQYGTILLTQKLRRRCPDYEPTRA